MRCKICVYYSIIFFANFVWVVRIWSSSEVFLLVPFSVLQTVKVQRSEQPVDQQGIQDKEPGAQVFKYHNGCVLETGRHQVSLCIICEFKFLQ